MPSLENWDGGLNVHVHVPIYVIVHVYYNYTITLTHTHITAPWLRKVKNIFTSIYKYKNIHVGDIFTKKIVKTNYHTCT